MRSVLLLVVVLVAPVLGQKPYGTGTPGTGGIVPRLGSGQAWMGNGAFSLAVSQGRGGAVGLIGISQAPGSTFVSGAEILIDFSPGQLLGVFPVPLGGAPGAAGAGVGSLQLPIGIPVMPSLAGLHFYCQAVIDDPGVGGAAATQGLDIEIAMPPEVFVGTSVGGSADPTWLVDPQTQMLSQTINSGMDNVTDAAWGNGGRNLFVGLSLGGSIRDVDVSTFPATVGTLYNPGQACYGIVVDDERKILYSLVGPGLGVAELTAVSYAPTTYGQVLGSTTTLTSLGAQFVERMAISPTGLIVVVTTFNPSQLVVVNTDPSAPAYLTTRPPAAFAASPLAVVLPARVAVNVDGTQAVVTLSTVSLTGVIGEVARYDIANSVFLDHNPNQAGLQHIGPQSLPVAPVPLVPDGLSIHVDGRVLAVCGGSSVDRLDLDPANPAFWSYTALNPVGLPQAAQCDLSGDGTTVAVSRQVSSGTGAVVFVDMATGLATGSVALPGANNLSAVAFR